MELDNSLTNEDLQDLHEDILDRNEDGVRSLLNEFRGQGELIYLFYTILFRVIVILDRRQYC